MTSVPGVDHPEEQGEVSLTLLGRHISVSARVELVASGTISVRPSVGEFYDQAVASVGDRVEIFWKGPEDTRSLPAEVLSVEQGAVVRWRLQVTGERPSAGGTIITSQIIKSTGEPVNINYLMRNNGGMWQIADVYLDGTISELATRRSEFASILRTGGINGLIQTLNSKADTLSASPGVLGRAS